MNRKKKQHLPHALLNRNWKNISENATEISLHDQYITMFIRDGNDIILYFEEGFFIDKAHPKNNTGEHQFSTYSAIILQDGNLISSEERLMDGNDSPSHSRCVLLILVIMRWHFHSLYFGRFSLLFGAKCQVSRLKIENRLDIINRTHLNS